MNPSAQRKYRREFQQTINRAIIECSRRSGATDLETVNAYVRRRNSILYKRIQLMLAQEQIRVIIQKSLKRCAVSVRKAADAAYRRMVQAEFDFFGMEQFRGVPHRITVPAEDGPVLYVEYNRSTEGQRLASIEHLESCIQADVARRAAEASANDWLHPLVLKWGDLPAEMLAYRWLQEKNAGGQAHG